MPVQLSKSEGNQIYHRDGDKSNNNSSKAEKYSIFGAYKMMNYAYVTIANEERNNRGLYTEPTIKDVAYYNQGITKPIAPKIHKDVWTLSQEQEKDELTPPPTPPQHTDDAITIPNDTAVNVLKSRKFVWPYGGKNVSVTGTFDNWQASIQMTPVNTTEGGFEVTVDNLDLTKDILYKFIVDGEWCYDVKKDYIIDETRNINNIIYAAAATTTDASSN